MSLAALAALILVGSFAASAALTPLAGRVATALGVVDRPGGRKAHERPTPLLGGAPIFLALVAVLGGGAAVTALAGDSSPLGGLVAGYAAERARAIAQVPRIAGFLAGLAVAFATGLIDDRWKEGFPAWAKLAGQALAAAIAVASGARADVLGSPAANGVASALWIVAIANAFNFLDHADGLAATIALVASAIFGAVALVQQQYFMAIALAALAGGTGGFLVHNFPPAKIFLGDAGALTIGYALGTLTLLESYVTRSSPGYLPVLVPLLVLALPLLDMAVVVVARLRAGKPIYVGDRNHFHHRLVRLGFTPREALATAALATLALGAGAAALPEVSWAGAAAIAVQAAATMGVVVILMKAGRRTGTGGE